MSVFWYKFEIRLIKLDFLLIKKNSKLSRYFFIRHSYNKAKFSFKIKLIQNKTVIVYLQLEILFCLPVDFHLCQTC